MEKEKLFYDLHQTIKDVGANGESTSLHLPLRSNWIKQLTGEISQMDDKKLEMVFDVYSRLTSYTLDNLNFIILHSNMLEYMFYENGEIIEENLALLYAPYADSLIHSPIITKHCFKNNISGNAVWNATLRCVCSGEYDKFTIENLILGDEVKNYRIIEAFDLLLELYETLPEFVEPLKEGAGPLYKTLIDIHDKTDEKDVSKQLSEYKQFLQYYKCNSEIIYRVLMYITSHDFVPYETVKTIKLLDIKDSDNVISKYGNNILSIPGFKALLKDSEKIADKLHELYLADKLSFKEFCRFAEKFSNYDESELEMIEKLL